MLHKSESGLDLQAIAAQSRGVARECWTAVLLSGLPSAAYRGLDSFIARVDELCQKRLAAPTQVAATELELVL